MPVKKRSVTVGSGKRKIAPVAGRPHIPGYGIPENDKGLLPWFHVTERMDKAMHYWVSTVDPNGRPHSTPVDGLWLDDSLYFGGSPQTRRNRNLTGNPAACIHLESGTDVVILHGDALEIQVRDRALSTRLAEASKKKYGYGLKPEQYEKSPGIFLFRPKMVLAWKSFPKDATRWRLD